MLLDDELAAQRHMNSTPSHPPRSASGKTPPEGELSAKAEKDQRGIVNMTPAASDSPAEPVVARCCFREWWSAKPRARC